MNVSRFLACPIALLALVVIGSVRAADGDSAADEQLVRGAGLGTDGPALLAFFRQRTQTSAARERMQALVAQLTDRSAEARDRASAELVSLGPLSIPYLREAAKDVDDRERSGRARRCLEAIEGPSSPALVAAAARLLVRRQPEAAAEVLLVYLPLADNDHVVEQLKEALTVVASRNGKPEPVLVKALADKLSIRRAIAAEVLSRVPNPELAPTLRKLLQDPAASVRLRIALALGQRQDAEAVGVLIALLGELPLPQARQAEEFLFDLACDQAPPVLLGEDEASQRKASVAWQAWWKGTEGPGVLDEFRKRTLTDADREKAQALIQQLGDNSYEKREQATAALSEMNVRVLPLLKQALASSDLEVRNRAERCVTAIDSRKDKIQPLSPVVPRLVALRRPAGAAEALLGYLAVIDEDPVNDEVQSALSAVAVRAGKPDAVLVRALEDRLPRRRAAAAAALVQAGVVEYLPAARKMLHDADAEARLTVALALADARDKEAVPALIDVLAEVPADMGAHAEDYLRLLAGDGAPKIALGADAADRKKCRDAWAAWWKDHAGKVEMVALPRVMGPSSNLGYTLLVIPDVSQVMELGRDGKPRWTLTGITNPFDAQVLPNDHVLIAEWGMQRVVERNLKNEVIWEKKINGPAGCQRLPNGNTFITTPYQLVEVDRTGKEVLTVPNRGMNYMSALKLRNGQIVCITNTGMCQRLDATGKEVKSFRMINNVGYVSIDVLPNGHVVVPHLYNGKVVEYDGEGKIVWEASIQNPTSATRLSNGHTLVSCQYPGKVVEIDRTGKVVWEHATTNQMRVQRARRR